MVAPKGSRLHLAFGLPQPAPPGTGLTLNFTDAQPPLGYVGVAYQGAMGAPTVRFRARELRPRGIAAEGIGNAVVERESQRIFAEGWQSSSTSQPKYVSWRRFITPAGIASPKPPFMPSLRLAGGYQPAPGSNIILNFAEPLQPPPGSAVVLEFGAVGYGWVLGATAGDTSGYGVSTLTRPESARPQGIAPPAMGRPTLELGKRTVFIAGFNAQEFGGHHFRLGARPILPSSIVSQAFGTANVWNWLQFVYPRQFMAGNLGNPRLLGGKKDILPGGIGSPGVGRPSVVNTRADQTVRPSGFTHYAMGAPVVSPRFLRPGGILGTLFGTPLVQKHPVTIGWESLKWGVPTVYDRTKYVKLAGIAPADPQLGYPVVRDRAQRVLHIASPYSAVFGDVLLRLKNFRVNPVGFDDAAVNPWAELRNRNRVVHGVGFRQDAIGGAEIRNKTPSFAPRSWDSAAFGEHHIDYVIRMVRAAGIPAPLNAFGQAKVERTPSLEPRGIYSQAMGETTVWNAIRYVELPGRDMATVGEATVWYRYRHITPEGKEQSSAGLPRLEHGNREILGHGRFMGGHGTPWVSFAQRFVAPKGIELPEEGATHVVGGTQHVAPAGYVATLWGSRIIPEVQTLAPLGFAEAFGWPRLHNVIQFVQVPSVRTYNEPQQQFGRLQVYNLRQYITMYFDPDSMLNPPSWPIWTLVENRNRYPRAIGWVATMMGKPFIDNKARPILPVGMAAPGWAEGYKWGLVAYRVRRLPLEGMEPPYISGWGIVRNNARLLQPAGLVATAFGATLVENRSREYKYIGAIESGVLGYPFVAERIREITFETRYAIAPPRIELPNVRLHTRYVEPKGIEEKQVGNAALEIHWKKITPRWTMVNYYGYAVVRNLTPELPQRGYDMAEFGDTFVRLQWRPVAPDGADTSLFGRTTIADRTRRIQVAGTNMLRIGDKLQVIRMGVPPLGEQFVWLDSLDPLNDPEAGYGIPAPRYQVGRPHMQQQVVYPVGIEPDRHFGTAFVHANSIRVEPGIYELTVGEPFVGLRIRTITADKSIESAAAFGKPRLTPHTIYAVVEAPAQAIENHERRELHYVDGHRQTGKGVGVQFGRVTLTLQHRVVAQRDVSPGNNHLRLGTPSVVNLRQYVNVNGFYTQRMGWPTLPYEAGLEQFDASNTMAFGRPLVAFAPYMGPRTLQVRGLLANQFGITRIELLHRTVHARGHDSMAMGTRKSGDSPYQWQGLRVGPLVPTIPRGYVAELFGVAWVSFRVRGVACAGFDTFLSEYDYQAFAQRMRVRNATFTRPLSTWVGGLGHNMQQFGTPGVRLGVHYIRPDGNAEQFRKGAPV